MKIATPAWMLISFFRRKAILLALLALTSTYLMAQNPSASGDTLPCHFLFRIPVAHCKRGPERCPKCKEMNYERYCLLHTCVEGDHQRRVIDLQWKGKTYYTVVDVLRQFPTPHEAVLYAAEHPEVYITFHEDILAEDEVLAKRTETMRNAGWKTEWKNSGDTGLLLLFYKPDTIWTMKANNINVTPETVEEFEVRMKTYGVKGRPEIAISFAPAAGNPGDTQFYSVKIMHTNGVRDEFHAVFPYEITLAVYKAEQILLGKN